MEQNAQSAANNPDAAAMDSPRQLPDQPTPRRRHNKSRGPMNIVKVAQALFRTKRLSSKSNTPPVNDGSRSIWRKVVGSMRPLHLQSNPPSPTSLQPNPSFPLIKATQPSEKTDHAEDALSYASMSPVVASHCHSPSLSTSSYATAVALNELDQLEKDSQEDAVEEEEEEKGDGNCRDMEEDTMIDAKAEEFIARFYHQMRLQRLEDDIDRRYRARSLRSLG